MRIGVIGRRPPDGTPEIGWWPVEDVWGPLTPVPAPRGSAASRHSSRAYHQVRPGDPPWRGFPYHGFTVGMGHRPADSTGRGTRIITAQTIPLSRRQQLAGIEPAVPSLIIEGSV